MTTVAELLQQRRTGTTVADKTAERDRAWETRSMVPPLEENPETWAQPAPVGYESRNPVEPQITETDPMRDLKIGMQGSGRGLAGLAGLPVDLAEMGLNLAAFLAEGGLDLAGADVDLPRFQNSVGGGQSIADVFGGAVEGAMGDDFLIERDEMSPDEKLRYSINQFGAEGAAGGGLLSRAKGSLPRSLTAPYEASGSNARVMLGDTTAGMGAGAGMELYDQYAPEAIRDSEIGRFIAGLLGGIGGATLPNAGEAVVSAGRGVAGNRAVPEGVIPRDPDTMLPVLEKDVRRASALYQDRAIDPATASRRIEEYLTAAGDGVDPTSALIADDPGLLTAERRLRAQDPAPFIERDRAVMNDVSDKVSGVRPENADPAKARKAAATSIEDQLATARSGVTDATGRLTRQDEMLGGLAEELLFNRGRDQASRDLDRVLVDETYVPARTEKNRLYDEAANSGAMVPTDRARSAATGERDRIDRANPALRDGQSRTIADAFASDEMPERPLGDAMVDRRALSTAEQEARGRSDFGRADTARAVKQGINEDIRAAAESGAPGTEALAAADTNYREKFAPYFRSGNAAPDFFKGVDKDPSRGSMPPEATAERFLRAGPTSRAAAEDVAKILEISPGREEGLAAVREYVKADAVSKGVIRDGKINENALARYIADREGMLGQIPGLQDEFGMLLGDVRSGNANRSRLADELDAATGEAKLTEQQMNEGALRLVVDAEPRKAVAGVLARPDSKAAMKEVVESLSGNPEALDGWKAAVADYFTRQVTTASKAAVSDGADTVSLPKLKRTFEDNADALAEVFSPEEMNTLRQVQTRLEVMSNRGAQASAGSATAENLGPIGNAIMALAQPIGAVTLLNRGALMAGSVERRVKMIAEQFPNSDAAANKLILRASFDPKLAKHLLDFPASDEQVYTWSKKLNQMIVLGAAEGEDD